MDRALVDHSKYLTPKRIMRLSTAKPKEVPSVHAIQMQQEIEVTPHEKDANIATEGYTDVVDATLHVKVCQLSTGR